MNSSGEARWSFGRRVALVAAVVLLLLLLWTARSVLLLGFAGVLLGIALRTPAAWLAERSSISPRWALAVVVLGVIAIFGGAFWLRGPAIAREVDVLREQLPRAGQQFQQWIAQYEWGRRALEEAPDPRGLLPDVPGAVRQATGVLSRAFNAIANTVIVLFLGIVLAAQPRLYVDGLVALVPPERRTRAREIIGEVGSTLQQWLFAQLIAMTVVGVLTGLGLWALGVPLAFTLAVIAWLLVFVPFLGPLLSAVPAVLLAFLDGPQQALYVILLYLGIQTVESYLIQPIVQWKAVFIPPALIILGQLVFAILAGLWGLALAAPLVAAGIALTREIYVKDVLENRAVAVE